MTTSLSPLPVLRVYDNSGNLAISGSVYTYSAGTSTPQATYTDSTGGTPNTNPVILNSRGECSLWLTPGQSYKIVAFDASSNLLWSKDNITNLNLAASTGANQVGFIQAGAGAIATTAQTKMRQVLSVMDFGATGNGATDDTSAINAALTAAAASKQSVYMPGGTYIYAGSGVLAAGVVVHGDGRNATSIKASGATNTLFTCSGYGSGIRSVSFQANVPQTAGSYVVLSGVESFIEDFFMTGDFNGVLMTGSVSRIRHGRFQDGAAGAIRIRAEGGDNSQLIDDVLMGAQTPQISSAGIRVRNSAALIISNTSVIQQGDGLRIDPTTATPSGNTADGNVLSLYVNNCFFDNSSGSGINIVPLGTGSVVRCRFSNCWAGSSTANNITINNAGTGTVQGLHFASCHSVLSTGSGLTTGGTVSDISIVGGEFCQNNFGMYFSTGATNINISEATIGAGAGLNGNTLNSIVINAGCDFYNVSNNIMRGNGASASFTATANRYIANNIGDTATSYNWTAYTPTVTATVGALTTVVKSGAYLTLGNIVFFQVNITITTNGTGSAALTVSLPVGVVATLSSTFAGTRTNDGVSLAAYAGPGGTTINITKYDGTYPGADGKAFVISGYYAV